MADDVAEIPRPRANPDLNGHAAAEGLLRQAFDSGRLAHAWLICGPRGIGKATLAFRFARFVLAGGADEDAGDGLFGDALAPAPGDRKGEGLHVDPDHPVFRRVASGGHADLLTVERAVADEKTGRLRQEIVVDDVRGIGGFLSLTPAEGGWRVVIIDAADEMNRNAANAVLKVLEEPPARALLLLVSHNPGRLLPTVRSRCRKLFLRPLEPATVVDLLGRYRPDLEAESTQALAALADGSIGRALDLEAAGGLEFHRDLLRLLATLPDLDVPAAHAFADKVGRAGADEAFRAVTDMLRWWLGRVVRSAARRTLPDGAEDAAVVQRLAAASSLDRWLEVWEKINLLLARSGSANLERKQVVLNAFLALQDAARS